MVQAADGVCSRIVLSSQQSLAGILAEHRRVTDPRNVLVFATSRGTMLNPSNIRRRWHAPAIATAGLEHVRLHDL